MCPCPRMYGTACKRTFASISGASESIKHTAGVLPTGYRYGLCTMCAGLSAMSMFALLPKEERERNEQAQQ
jgi:hypothetical protein